MKIINPNVHFSTINTIRNNAITNWYSEPWLNVVEVLISQKHTVSESKDVVCISPWLYKTFDDGALPRRTDDGELWTIDDTPVVARLADNVSGTNLLMLDFDGGLTIKHAKSIFSTYAHCGYTSYSHMSPKKDYVDCFRIMLPLASFVSTDELVKRRKAIYAQFSGIDISCLSLARSFYLPSCPPERQNLAQMWDNHAELFDVLHYDCDVEFPMFASPSVERPVDKQKIIDSLKKIYVGHEPTWFNIAVAMSANDFSESDFIEVTVGFLMKEKTPQDCKQKWKDANKRVAKGKGIAVGYLINLCKSNNVWTLDTHPDLEFNKRKKDNFLTKKEI